MAKRLAGSALLATLLSVATLLPAPVRAQNFGAAPNWNITVDWQLVERNGQLRVEGRVVNGSLYIIVEVRVLVESLDASGQVQGTHVVFMPGALNPGMHGDFDVAVPAAATHRVTLINYDRVESPSFP